MRKGKKQGTIKDVARAAGVSTSTVSKVLNKTKSYPRDTRIKVLRAARQEGYIPNPSAQSMVTGRTRVIGVKILDITNPYFANIVKGAQSQAFREGYSLVVADSQENPDTELQTLQELSRRSDGLILAGSRLTDQELMGLSGMPTVLIGRAIQESKFVCILQPVEVRLGLAMQHFAELGHRHIALLLPKHAVGYKNLLDRYETNGFTLEVVQMHTPDMQEGERVATDLFSRTSLPTAVFGYNDLTAYGVMRAAQKASIRIPEDVSLIGSDDLDYNDLTSPRLTSLSGDQFGVGLRAIEILVQWIRNGHHRAQTIRLDSELVLRGSTCPPSRGNTRSASVSPTPPSE